MRTRNLGAIVAVTGLAFSLSACSQNNSPNSTEGYRPSGNITMVVPFGAGGGSDISGRAIGDGLSEVTDLAFTTENRDGGSGAVGFSYFLSLNGQDNYLLPAETAMLALPISQPDVQFAYTDFTPIMKLGDDASIMIVREDSPYNSCTELVDASSSSRVIVGVSGAISNDAVIATLLESETGASLDSIPFESGGEVTAALLGGQVDVIFSSPSEIQGQLDANAVKPLCVFSENRFEYEELADIPTAVEQGIDVTFSQFRSFIAPGGISEEARQYWLDAAQQYAESEAYTSYIEDNRMQSAVLYGDEFVAFLEDANTELQGAIGN